MFKQTIISLAFLLFFFGIHAQNKVGLSTKNLPSKFQTAIKNIEYDSLGQTKPQIKTEEINKNVVRVKMSFSLDDSLEQDDWQVNFTPAFQPTFNWAPHLTPKKNYIIAQHVFRAPTLMASNDEQLLVIIPDIDLLTKDSPVDWYMDMDAPHNRLTLGMSKSKVVDHILFKRAPGASYPKGRVEYGFYLMSFDDKEAIKDPFRKPLSFFWKHWGKDLFKKGEPIRGDLKPYVKQTYKWAFDSWKDQVWQQFQIDDKEVGAPTFIVNVTQSPNYPGKVNEREFRSIWNQAWFNSLRSASGLYRYARRTSNDSLMKKAEMTKELALSFPKKDGFFYGLIGTEMDSVKIDGKKYNRSKGWDTRFWGNSNRNPYTPDPKKSPFHILDMSWTAYQMLQWYDELEEDDRLLKYAKDYADALVKSQNSNGYFPTWLDIKSLKPLNKLKKSPESSMSVTFLLKLYRLTDNTTYKKSAIKATKAIVQNNVYQGRWEDFETYWSGSRIGSDDWVGHKVERNNMFKQNNFSMFWTAWALMESYKTTQEQNYLEIGQRVLDELLMTQATWQPYFIHVHALGGFGVLNADGEWDDARQSLFAELILKYGMELKKKAYVERGLAAMRASFVMMYSPDNPETKSQWEKRWPFFGREDYGFMMENYGHGGKTSAKGLGIGEFTIYDWGNGAASEAYNRIIDHFGKDFINNKDFRQKKYSFLKDD